MSRQAEAERERRARIITADGEYQASKRLAAAANVMARDPAALQLRLLQTVVEVAAAAVIACHLCGFRQFGARRPIPRGQ
jgi:regulator of protease activity HflC (stomatin/prohibitin superfamily)